MGTEDDGKKTRRVEEISAGRASTKSFANPPEWTQPEHEEAARVLRALRNDELRIERSMITRNRRSLPRKETETDVALNLARRRSHDESGGRDAGGGFDPYDHSEKPRRRS
jgi:hypothetical protein